MLYNQAMALKQKFALWLSKEQAEKFLVIYQRAKHKEGRTNYSEVIKELMGFPVEESLNPVTTPEDRQFLSGKLAKLPDTDFIKHKSKIAG